MPELPEVETVRRDLAASVKGRRISGVRVLNQGSVKGMGSASFVRRLRDRRLERFHRRGKYLLIGLDEGRTLAFHLKMTGVLQHQRPDDSLPRAARIIFCFKGGDRLVFSDQRKFGSVTLAVDGRLPELEELGPEPLSDKFTTKLLASILEARNAPIKATLLDQSAIAGLGNIYACEALHRAGILPQRPAKSLKAPEVEKLHRAIRRTLTAAIRARGSSVDTYRDGRGRRGWFQVSHRVYDRQGKKCKRCGCGIIRETLRGRGTYWCPGCQK